MTNALTLPIKSRDYAHGAPRRVNRRSASYVAAVLWTVYFVVISYFKAWFNDDSAAKYYFQIVLMLLIFWYELHKILQASSVKRINLLVIYSAILMFQYILLLSGLEKVVLLGALLVTLLLFKKYAITVKERRRLYYIFALAVLLKVANGATVETMSDKSKFNPNECAIALMCLFCMSIVGFTELKRVIFLVIAVACFVLQFYFRSRGALLGCVTFAVIVMLMRRKTMRVKTAVRWIFILSMAGVAVAYVYSEVLFPLIGHGKVVILGKDLFTGRQVIWSAVFESIENNLFIGVGNKLNEDLVSTTQNSLYMNAHNQSLGVLAAFGIVNFLLFYLLFAKYIAMPMNAANNKRRITRAPVVFMSVITIMNYFETLFFSQWAIPMVLVAYVYLLNCHCVRKIKVANTKNAGNGIITNG